MPILSVLTIDECERLLRRGTFGRVVLVTPRGPDIFPVNYLVQGGEIVVRVSPESQLVRHGHGAEVVFEVDHVDEERWHGWSVVARGRAQVVTEPIANAGRTARPWVDGDHHCEVRLEWDQLTGRKVGTGWDTEAGLYSLSVEQ
jgi:nitroimidazol reductase NimA-like FMN-containing flavoprotein (pyridoxamine 5'-phosphate oxidase superfamily)